MQSLNYVKITFLSKLMNRLKWGTKLLERIQPPFILCCSVGFDFIYVSYAYGMRWNCYDSSEHVLSNITKLLSHLLFGNLIRRSSVFLQLAGNKEKEGITNLTFWRDLLLVLEYTARKHYALLESQCRYHKDQVPHLC